MQILPQQPGSLLLDVDLALEVRAVTHLHKFVGVARIAVFAGEFAAAVGIDSPGKRHADAGAAVEKRPDGQGEVLDLVALADGFAFSGQAGDADEFGLEDGEQGREAIIRSPYVRLWYREKIGMSNGAWSSTDGWPGFRALSLDYSV